ncbi:hypothetical protein KEM52_000078 [Ascosphaera acerosa]|nr:hypothetical protein KEM52_000078 [Ascosphaera acerosa]
MEPSLRDGSSHPADHDATSKADADADGDRPANGDLTDADASALLSTSLVPARSDAPSAVTTIDFDGLLAAPVKISQDLRNGCGGQTWPAGMVLAKYMMRNHLRDLQGKTIVELGAGGGLVGLALAQACREQGTDDGNGTASFVRPLYITDQIPMLHLMQENIAQNGLGDRVCARVLDWGEPIPRREDATPDSDDFADDHGDVPAHPDIILAADCVYFEPAFPLLLATLTDLLAPRPGAAPSAPVCYFCHKKRRKADMRFIKMAKKKFDMVQVTDYEGYEENRRDNIFLYTIRRKGVGN